MGPKQNIYVMYASKDKNLAHNLLRKFQSLENDYNVSLWHDRPISSDARWKPMDIKRLNEADTFLLFVSNAFMYSPFIEQDEFKMIIDRHKGGEAKVLPILLDTCPWDAEFNSDDYNFSFKELQVLPKDRQPISDWSTMDEALAHVVGHVKEYIGLHNENDEPADDILDREKTKLSKEEQIALNFAEEAELIRKAGEKQRAEQAKITQKVEQVEVKRKVREIRRTEKVEAIQGVEESQVNRKIGEKRRADRVEPTQRVEGVEVNRGIGDKRLSEKSEITQRIEEAKRIAKQAEAKRIAFEKRRLREEAEIKKITAEAVALKEIASAKKKDEEEKKASEAAEVKRTEEKKAAEAAEVKRAVEKKNAKAAELKRTEQKKASEAAEVKRALEKNAAEAAELKRTEEKNAAEAAKSKRIAFEKQKLRAQAEAKESAAQQLKLKEAAEAKRKDEETKRVAEKAEAKKRAEKAKEQKRTSSSKKNLMVHNHVFKNAKRPETGTSANSGIATPEEQPAKSRKKIFIGLGILALAIAVIWIFNSNSEKPVPTLPEDETITVINSPVSTTTEAAGQEETLSTLAIGDIYAKGFIFVLDESGKTGKIAHFDDQGPMSWQKANSINEQLGEEWRLPTLGELQLMRKTIGQGATNKGEFSNGLYWSATPFDTYQARLLKFSNGNATYHYNKAVESREFLVRAVRDFSR